MDLKNLFFDKRQVGRTVKASKVYYVWEFVIEGKLSKIEIFHSVVSGKKKLVLNGSVLTEEESYSADFVYHFKIKKHKIDIEQKASDRFDLTIDKIAFKTLVEDESQKVYKHLKKDVNLVEELISGKKGSSVQQVQQKGSIRTDIPNFFDDNDFDFGGGQSQSNQPNDLQYEKQNQNNNQFDFGFSESKIEEPQQKINNQKISNQTQQSNFNDLFGLDIDFQGNSNNNQNVNENQETSTKENNFFEVDFTQNTQNKSTNNQMNFNQNQNQFNHNQNNQFQSQQFGQFNQNNQMNMFNMGNQPNNQYYGNNYNQNQFPMGYNPYQQNMNYYQGQGNK